MPVTQQCSIELRLSRLPSLDEDVFSCESIPEWSLSSSTKGSPPPAIPTKHSVIFWTGLAFMSRMCQGTGGRGTADEWHKGVLYSEAFQSCQGFGLFKKEGETKKKEVKCSKTKAVQNIPLCCLPPEMSLQLVHSQALPAGSWDILTSISLKQQCRGEADAPLCISTMREEAQHFKLPPALLLSTVKRSVMKITAAITSPSCPWDLPCPAEEEKGQ